MKLLIEIGQDHYDLVDDMTAVLIAKCKKDCKEYLEVDTRKHPDDIRQYKKLIKACDTLLAYYRGPDGDN